MSYFSGRQRYDRPQAMLWSESVGTLADVPVVSGIAGSITGDTITLNSGYTTANMKIGQKVYKTSGSAIIPTSLVITQINSNEIVVSQNATLDGSLVFYVATSLYLPTTAYERGASITEEQDAENPDFIILSDHNRSPINISPIRLELRERMVNGRMRSYHIADKLKISTSWQMIPSRSYSSTPNFDTSTGTTSLSPYTVDGGAGGAEMLSWYRDHTGPFWVYLAYDDYRLFGDKSDAYAHFAQYNQVLEMYISDFNYEVIKRGGTQGSVQMDLWNVSVTLEEA